MKYILLVILMLAGCASKREQYFKSARPMTVAEDKVWEEVKQCVADFLPFVIPVFFDPRVDRHPTRSLHYPGLIIIKSGLDVGTAPHPWKHEMGHEIDIQLGNSPCMHTGESEQCSNLWEWSRNSKSYAIFVCQYKRF